MKASENETVADIVKRVRRDCSAYPLPTAAAEMLKLVREVEAAHRREMDTRAIMAGVSLADAVDEAHKREVEELRGEVAEFERRLKVAEDALEVCIGGMCGECHRQHLGETCVNGCYEMTAAKNALAALREEGGVK